MKLTANQRSVLQALAAREDVWRDPKCRLALGRLRDLGLVERRCLYPSSKAVHYVVTDAGRAALSDGGEG